MLLSSKDCLNVFGEPVNEKGMVLWDVPVELEIGVIPKKVYCNNLIIKPLEQVFKQLITTGMANELKTYDGCFNVRNKKGGVGWSLHSWGLAVDVNAAWNRMGKTPTLSNNFIKCFTDNGFDWGGNWKTPDGMHFQLKAGVIV